MTAAAMPSVLEFPEVRRTTTIRMTDSLREKIDAVVVLWRQAARAAGKAEDVVAKIDFTHVSSIFLERQADEELAQFGGFPNTKDKMEAVSKAIAQAGAALADTNKKKR